MTTSVRHIMTVLYNLYTDFITTSYRWSRDRARPHRIDGRHGMVTMAWHGSMRIDARGAARPS